MNTFNVGDKVKFLNEVGSGIVVEIIDDNMVMVETSDGFHTPFLARELINKGDFAIETDTGDEGELKEIPSDEQDNRLVNDLSKISSKEIEHNEEIYFAVVKSLNGESEALNAYMINVCSYNVMFHLSSESADRLTSWVYDDLETDEKILLGPLPKFNADGFLQIVYQFIFYQKECFRPVEPLKGVVNLSINKIKSVESFRKNDFFDEDALLLPLIDKYEIITNTKEFEIKDDFQIDNKAGKNLKRHKIESGIEEVDLHAEQIVENVESYDSSEILEMQLARFEMALEGAIRNKQKRIIFIHGTGAGKLKHKIRKLLDDKYSRLKYQDASFKEYGYGATLVLIS